MTNWHSWLEKSIHRLVLSWMSDSLIIKEEIRLARIWNIAADKGKMFDTSEQRELFQYQPND